MARFKPGESGNPSGRKLGSENKVTKLRRSLEKDLPDVLAALVDQAKSGDVQAIKILLDRVMPALRPQDTPVQIPLDNDLTQSGRAVLAAVGAGMATPEQGKAILTGIGSLARIVETDELLKRIEVLEKRYAESDREQN
ncbi:DUF5681 domain-containing protein [Imhoffiella purpurea]|uniref:DUF5681 domain-containing protein n=1 Tax=Imhoffiella purpurea TaxID=1249627 RepID=UPI0005C24541|nr:DUF5681 domain-containing protein [Imhoffiella purpurea]